MKISNGRAGTLEIHSAALEDIPEIRKVGTSAWWNTYSGLMSEERIRDRLSRWWSRAYLARTISSSKHSTLVGKLDGQVVAYSEAEILDNTQVRTLGIDEPHNHQAV